MLQPQQVWATVFVAFLSFVTTSKKSQSVHVLSFMHLSSSLHHHRQEPSAITHDEHHYRLRHHRFCSILRKNPSRLKTTTPSTRRAGTLSSVAIQSKVDDEEGREMTISASNMILDNMKRTEENDNNRKPSRRIFLLATLSTVVGVIAQQETSTTVASAAAVSTRESENSAVATSSSSSSSTTKNKTTMTVVGSTKSTRRSRNEEQIELMTTLTTASTATATSTAATGQGVVNWDAILKKASKKALGGGKAGASAAVVQVCSLMWLRTSMNYQYRYGGNLQTSLDTLWKEGGIGRLYQGLPFALIQGPMTRFGDTAANVGILAFLDTLPTTQNLPLPFKTACGSIAAGVWRIFLMPVDISKTSMQVEGLDGLRRLWTTVVERGQPGPLYRGALAQAAATAVGHFPWFLTYNFLDERIPTTIMMTGDEVSLFQKLVRSAVLGLSASCVSDCVSNSLRVIKTTKQTIALGGGGAAVPNNSTTTGITTNATRTMEVMDAKMEGTINDQTQQGGDDMSYLQIVRMIIEQDGVVGLFGRGLQTRLLTNAIQGAMFSVLWRYFQEINAVK